MQYLTNGCEDGVLMIQRKCEIVPPLHYIISIDRSSSMAEKNRFQIGIKIFTRLVEQLRDCDRVSVFLFNHEVDQVQNLGKRENIQMCELQDTELMGMTNLELLFEEVSKCALKDTREWIDLILTDGLPTCGSIRTSLELANFRKSLFENTQKPRLSWFGVIGTNSQWELARDCAHASSGTWTHLPDDDLISFLYEVNLLQRMITNSSPVKINECEKLLIGDEPNFIYCKNYKPDCVTIECKWFVELMRLWQQVEDLKESKIEPEQIERIHTSWSQDTIHLKKSFDHMQFTLLRKILALKLSSATFHPDACLDIRRMLTLQM